MRGKWTKIIFTNIIIQRKFFQQIFRMSTLNKNYLKQTIFAQKFTKWKNWTTCMVLYTVLQLTQITHTQQPYKTRKVAVYIPKCSKTKEKRRKKKLETTPFVYSENFPLHNLSFNSLKKFAVLTSATGELHAMPVLLTSTMVGREGEVPSPTDEVRC